MGSGFFIERSVVAIQGNWRPALAAFHVGAAALLVTVAAAWGRHAGRRLLVTSGFVTVLALTSIGLVNFRPSDVPIEWITIVQNGLEQASILQLYTMATHAGMNFPFVVSAVAGLGPNLRDFVWFNILLAVVNAAIFAHIAMYVTGPIWALAWTAVFALNAITFQASFSELATNLLGLYFLAGVMGWVTLNDPLPQPRAIRAAGWTLCAVLTLLTLFTRLEVALIGMVALGLHAAYIVVGAQRWSAAGQRLRHACERPLAFLADHPVAVVALSLVGMRFAMAGIHLLPGGLSGREPLSGWYPFNPSILQLYVFLPMLVLPVGVTIATLLGSVRAIRQFRWFGGLALSLLVIVRAYFSDESTFYEMARYLAHILPAIFLLGLFGKRELEVLVAHWSPNWRHAAQIAYLMAWFTFPLPGFLELWVRPDFHLERGMSQLLLERDTQREVRHLVALTEKNPQCVFVARVVNDQSSDWRAAPRYVYAIFGRSIARPIFVPEQDATLDAVIAHHAPDASCVRLYYGGDCNLNIFDHCTQFIAGRQRLEEIRFWSRPYNNPHQLGYASPEVVLATYAWP
jgi:hypothetical protein